MKKKQHCSLTATPACSHLGLILTLAGFSVFLSSAHTILRHLNGMADSQTGRSVHIRVGQAAEIRSLSL